MAEVKERPIRFNGPMVRAVLAGDKTQTRRIAKPVKHPDLGNLYDPGALVLEGEPKHFIDRACPYGQPGDRLWVRETWSHANNRIAPYSPGVPVHYRADYLDEPDGADGELAIGGKYRYWLPSIHMPRSASRLVLEITGVRVERLQAISRGDAMAEGCPFPNMAHGDDPRQWYAGLCNSINGAGAWEVNPWVWVVEFRVLPTQHSKDGGRG